MANGRTEENQRRLPLAAKQRKKVEELLEHGQTFDLLNKNSHGMASFYLIR